MEYIIAPKLIYWINTFHNIQTALLVIAIFGGAFSLTMTCILFAEGEDLMHDYPKWKKRVIAGWIAESAIVIALVFLPSRKTIIEMMVARIATRENIELTVDGLKSVVDYIAETISNMK